MNRLSTQMFVDYLATQTDIRIAVGRIPDMPNRAMSVTRTASGRDLNDGLFEEIVFRIQTRGRGSSVDDAEQIAIDIDNLLHESGKFDIGPVYIQHISHNSAPRQINITDPQSRFNFTADYKVVASKD